MSYCMTPDDQEEEHSRLYALKGMFHGVVEKIEKKYCLPQGGEQSLFSISVRREC